mmetsp:Transcript_35107/g.35744  ORF Transcript_35107/g.35744 Transcript_35107/m.35744 type:complete len:161 (+) Transcript_35107:310-792(+)
MESTELHKYLVINNISKESNIKALFITAYAHEFSLLIITNNFKDMEYYSTLGVSSTQFTSLFECKNYLQSVGVILVGIEIMEDAKSILSFPFSSSIAFMPGNEGTGLSNKQKEFCDQFVYIPQYGSGTASLNVNVATAIVLHQYQQWSLKEADIESSISK